MPELALVLGGTAYGGWTSIYVHRSLEEVAGSFELSLTERWPEHEQPLVIQPGAACVVTIDGKPVITGYVDAVDQGYDATNHTLNVSGRDKTADLVDCSATFGKGEWRNAKLDQVARDLSSPFGITVRASGDLGAPFPSFAIEPGESAYDCLERAARQRGLLLASNGAGELVVGQAGTGKVGTALRSGENLLSGAVRNDNASRYSQYTVLGQRAGSDLVSGAAAAHVKAQATDTGVARFRPLVIVDEDQGDMASFQRRAKWEASVRAARALTYTALVQGWTHASGLWETNTLVQVYDPVLRLARELLVRDVDYGLDASSGQVSQLVLTPAEAYSILKMPAKQKAPRRKKRRDSDDEDAF
ncbi:phage baseplate assembly protein [Pseudoxanthomonas winnipegensis]|uniref:phage baseplate assembly protein n=1 Tax=Pseudoxanthomonas winnipegensis TaxID=2480810 RepID=UPI0013F1649C|nr:contractile injection system protein, VgrG/Pvc8 family [Pseudoxanthomonas winnipegensis]